MWAPLAAASVLHGGWADVARPPLASPLQEARGPPPRPTTTQAPSFCHTLCKMFWRCARHPRLNICICILSYTYILRRGPHGIASTSHDDEARLSVCLTSSLPHLGIDKVRTPPRYHHRSERHWLTTLGCQQSTTICPTHSSCEPETHGTTWSGFWNLILEHRVAADSDPPRPRSRLAHTRTFSGSCSRGSCSPWRSPTDARSGAHSP